jgi:hypothetical protein
MSDVSLGVMLSGGLIPFLPAAITARILREGFEIVYYSSIGLYKNVSDVIAAKLY